MAPTLKDKAREIFDKITDRPELAWEVNKLFFLFKLAGPWETITQTSHCEGFYRRSLHVLGGRAISVRKYHNRGGWEIDLQGKMGQDKPISHKPLPEVLAMADALLIENGWHLVPSEVE